MSDIDISAIFSLSKICFPLLNNKYAHYPFLSILSWELTYLRTNIMIFEWSKILNEICLCHRDITNSICKYSISINYVSCLGLDSWDIIHKLHNVINMIKSSSILDYFLYFYLTFHTICIDGLLIIVKIFLSKSG